MELCQHQTDNYCCGYKSNHWNLNLMLFFFQFILHLYYYIYFMGQTEKTWKITKIRIQFEANYSITVVYDDQPKGSLHPWFMINQ